MRLLLKTLVMLCVLLMGAVPARAAVQEIRVVAAGVDPSPSKATQMAFEYAKKRAVYLLMVKMKIPNAVARAQALTDAQLQQVIRGATIVQTRQMEGMVYADVSVSIVDEALLHVLDIEAPKDAAALENTAPIKGVMVLPVYVTKARPFVWEKENILRDPMSSAALKVSQGTVVVPTGDYDDLRLIDQHNALTVKADDLQPMFDRYGVREIIIAVVPQEKEGSTDAVTILLRRLSPHYSHNEQITLPAPTATETADDRIKEITAEIAQAATQIAASTSKEDQEKMGAAPQVPVYFYYGSMHEIGQIQDAIRGTDGVLQLSMPEIALNNIHGVLYLSADKEIVRKALAKKGLIVTDHADGWQVSLR